MTLPMAPRPKQKKGKTVTSIYLDHAILSRVDKAAKAENRPRNYVMVRALLREVGLAPSKAA